MLQHLLYHPNYRSYQAEIGKICGELLKMTTQAMIVSAEKMKHIIWSEIIATSFHSDCIISLVLSASFCSSRSSVSFSKFLTIFPNCFSITRSSSVIKNLEPGVSNKLLALLALSEQSESS